MTEIPEHIQRDWNRYQEWGRLCQAGDCAYVGLHASIDKPRSDYEGERCPGYQGFLHIEHGAYVLRSCNCPRKRAWWKDRQTWIRAKRVEAKQAPAKSGWKRDIGEEG